MKLERLLILVAVCALFFCPAIGMAAPEQEETIEGLLKEYDHQRGKARVATADKIFDLLYQEEMTDERLEESARMPADSLDMLVWYWAGEYLWTTQDYADGLRYSEKALPLTARLGDPLLESDCERLVGLFYFRQSDYEQAVEHVDRSLELCRAEGDKSRIGSSLNTLAGICLTAKQLDESEKYILEAIRYCEEDNDTYLLPIRYGMASEVYHVKGEDAKSLDYARKAYQLDSVRNDTARMGIRLSQMASAQMALGQDAEAEQSLRRAIPILEQAGNKGSLSICHNQMGELLNKRGAHAEAVAHFEAAAEVFAARKDMYNESRAQMGLYEALKGSDPAAASRHLLRYSVLKDSIYRHDMEQAVSQFNVKYKTEELQRQQEKDRLEKRMLLFGLIALTSLLLLAAAIWFNTARMHRRKLEELERYLALRDKYAKEAAPEDGREEDIVQTDDSGILFLAKVSDAVHAQIDKNQKADVSSIASCLYMSNSQFYRRLVALTGLSPSAYIQRLKIQKAKELIDANPQMSFNEIADRCGFDTYPNFVRAFKNVTGATPTEYRKQSGV